ncbi:ABC transporter substrate-binding protein [Cobetia marina]|jgi:TRAP-type mannitol/chloroaromatic compound transport system substrate-binding protein|uniref:TRAP transporter substrate-binding protein DctP n=1 Tax=Cobetia marina TaxID=28258 RepID=A0ABU9GJM9_COBMA|nr:MULTISPECIES: TRAP transporter substrate-binding protein DctP [Cobetia]AOM01508.1 ABC transporter substrate-binding protein [Cobetia marina]AZV31424.1 ABC transporter substrate-binding protein [Cobetia sp. ICG0124]MDA5564434.1 TRAP transporter substrate-binding protein DctP [Cobetia sp. MMG027]MDH2291273.1 TRAP transporter substrate-binding protein DctP [Cobetia sp. 10Alg 146]MDH2374755.1 TRAP transporter substrate-binding protein DctP [Cobetia sp. 3AK]
MTFDRRKFLGAALATSTAGLVMGAPAIVRAESSKTYQWKMTNAYGPGSPFYVEGPGSPTDFCRKVEAMSGGRMKIQHFAAGELIPALEGFNAVASGVVEMNAGNAYFWAGKIPAAQYFTTVPFGMNTQGMNAWLYHGGGLELWHELYAPKGLIAFPMGNTGVQMTGWFRKPINTVEDLKGLKMRIPGLAGKVYAELGVAVRLLPGGEIFPALERGVIDAAEFVGPYQDRRLGLQKAAKYYYTTGWHEPTNVTELMINKAAWESLPEDLQAIVKAAAQACNVESQAWCESVNAEALNDLVENEGVTAQPLPDSVVARLKEVTEKTLTDMAAADPDTARVHESFMAFRDQHKEWAAVSEKTFLAL